MITCKDIKECFRRFVGLGMREDEKYVWKAVQCIMMKSDTIIKKSEFEHKPETHFETRVVPDPHEHIDGTVNAETSKTGRTYAFSTKDMRPDVLQLLVSKILQWYRTRGLPGKQSFNFLGNSIPDSMDYVPLEKDFFDAEAPDSLVVANHSGSVFPGASLGGDDDVDSRKSTSIASGSRNPQQQYVRGYRRCRMNIATASSNQAALQCPQEDEVDSGTSRQTKSAVVSDSKNLYMYRNASGFWYKIQTLEGLLHLRRKNVIKEFQDEVRDLEHLVKKRPYFTYWLMFVHILIMIITLSVYNFAPYSWDILVKEEFVLKSNLALEVAKKGVVGNVWGGPGLESLIELGANYAPCMRRDRLLYKAIDADSQVEANNSGCCVRRDMSGCVQVLSKLDCSAGFADFIYTYSETANSSPPIRAVCGTSPYTCITPDKVRNPNWNSGSISNWPICTSAGVSSASHLSCELTGKPCCVGIKAICLITTREHCNFLEGKFHQEAFLCSQVDCLGSTCGLIPFSKKNNPDQIYRLWLSLLLHAGIGHIILTLLFDILILRIVEKKLGCFRTCILYVGSGIGGNIISAVFVPYYPTVGPGSSIFGVIAYIFAFVIMESNMLENIGTHIAMMVTILLTALVMGVLLPIIDNFAHLGGLLFGFCFSYIFVQYYELDERLHPKRRCCGKDPLLVLKYVMLPLSLMGLVVFYATALVWFYGGQENWYGFTYVNCIPYTSTFCRDYGQNPDRTLM